MNFARPRRRPIRAIVRSAASRTRRDCSQSLYVNGAIVTGPAFGFAAPPCGGGA